METADVKPEQIALAKAVEQIGGYAATARALGLKTAWAVQKWTRCPAERVLAIDLLNDVWLAALVAWINGGLPAESVMTKLESAAQALLG